MSEQVHPGFITAIDPRGWLHSPALTLSPEGWQHALAAARACQQAPHPGVLEVLDVTPNGIVTRAISAKPVAALIARAGALDPQLLLGWVPRIADALAHLATVGVAPAIDPATVFVSEEAPWVLGFALPSLAMNADRGPAQVKALGALFYEGLKGMPPPTVSSSGDWVGVKPRLADVLGQALLGLPPSPEQLAICLRGLGNADTAGYLPALHDTRLSGISSGASNARRGELVGSYELEELIGTGGMGEVYLARHVRLSRRVALKFLRPELANQAEVVRRFFEEARVVNEINHPHIVQVLDFVEEPGRVYCVMELLRGKTLAQLALEQGPLRIQRVAGLLLQVCQALRAAHALGVVHRDIKPENIFVTDGPTGTDFVKVLDFGIAKQLRMPGQTQLGLVMGTPIYMPPEQAQGRSVDARADLYALGVVLWELLSGRSFQTVVGAPPPLLVSAASEPIPSALSKLIESCLQMEPALRPATANQVEQVLRGLGSPRRRSRGPWVAVGLVATVGAAAFLWVRPVETSSPLLVEPPPPTVAEKTEPVAAVDTPPEATADKPLEVAAVGAEKPRVPDKRPTRAATDLFSRRVAKLRSEFQRLTSVHGAGQLTSLERGISAGDHRI